MTRSVTAISTSTKSVLAAALLLISGAAAAQDDDENVRDREPDMGDVATTPISDLNIAKDDIPEVLLTAARGPYAPANAPGCDGIEKAIADLDRVLGPDYDLEDHEGDRLSEGRIAQSIVGSFIPFRSIIREVSGAADHQRDFQAAIMAGMVRRAFLKGLGQASGCPYPARPAFTRIAIDEETVIELEEPEDDKAGKQEPEATKG
ncbi:hypothetical protein SAMN06297468_2900 [Altererythrobacter xiamenensis]|uniref:Uncharacterized protein n=1 Tax=Altererythrobacter xiamenensis TaxID=1316679 RepID=A0A1Y6FIE4_9SPHN|nr:hypothetical protein [Altererythrobacter xiamenensis]SMQ74728.1 hypothetical protein SAMN06297468_2900 [Altererythrobacter xiamenensis]